MAVFYAYPLPLARPPVLFLFPSLPLFPLTSGAGFDILVGLRFFRDHTLPYDTFFLDLQS
jgi:hypothetical protein